MTSRDHLLQPLSLGTWSSIICFLCTKQWKPKGLSSLSKHGDIKCLEGRECPPSTPLKGQRSAAPCWFFPFHGVPSRTRSRIPPSAMLVFLPPSSWLHSPGSPRQVTQAQLCVYIRFKENFRDLPLSLWLFGFDRGPKGDISQDPLCLAAWFPWGSSQASSHQGPTGGPAWTKDWRCWALREPGSWTLFQSHFYHLPFYFCCKSEIIRHPGSRCSYFFLSVNSRQVRNILSLQRQ